MCPNQCTCQHQSFVSSSQSRWIDVNVSQDHPFSDPEATIKSIMCIVQNNYGFRDIVPSIPNDVQALTFLFTGANNQNITESKRKLKVSIKGNLSQLYLPSPISSAHGRLDQLP